MEKGISMSKQKSTDKFALGIAIVSLVVAVAAVALPYLEQRRQFQVLQTEELVIRLDPNADGSFRITNNKLGPMGHVVQMPWRGTFSNTGNQKLSITKYSISTGATPNSTFFSGIDGGIVQSDQKPIDLPLTLDPGETKPFVLLVGVLVPSAVHDVLAGLTAPSQQTVSKATEALAKRGMDLYGNKVEYKEYAPGGYMLTVENEDQKSPTYWFEATTGRGNKFVVSATSYERPK